MTTLSVDLWMLVAATMWTLALTAPLLVGRVKTPGGHPWALGNREEPFAFAPWLGRANRAHRNMVENLAPFAVLVLVCHVTGKANDLTALGSQIFVGARVAHALCYIAGLVPWRTLAFIVGFGAELVIFFQLL